MGSQNAITTLVNLPRQPGRKGKRELAIYHLSAQIIGKGGGRSAVAAAAYRHCARMDRAETDEEIDYSRKGGNAHSEFALPDNAPS